MTIHHDKLAYGKLAQSFEELTEQQLDEMLKQLNAEDTQSAEENNEKDLLKNPKKL